MAEPDATQLVAGAGVLYVAPLGSTLPTVAGHGEFPITWPVAWLKVGYTEDGIDLVYTPTIKELHVDEEAAPVLDVLATEKFHIAVKLAEATLQNMNRAISASTFTDNTAAGSDLTINAGSQALNYLMVGLDAPAPGTNKRRLMVVQKAIANASVNMKIQRKDKVVIPVTFEARKLSGLNLFDIWDFTSTAS